jgi:SNF2 family DNA or RNA helicase
MEFINKWDTEMAQNKLLIFSQTKKVLNIVETMLRSVGVDFVRMDGDVGLKQRMELI